MAFEKKTWYDNGAAPEGVIPPAIDAGNLNRIEDGIYQCSIAINRFGQLELSDYGDTLYQMIEGGFRCDRPLKRIEIPRPNVSCVRITVSTYGWGATYGDVVLYNMDGTESRRVVGFSDHTPSSTYFSTNCFSMIYKIPVIASPGNVMFGIEESENHKGRLPTRIWLLIEEVKLPVET